MTKRATTWLSALAVAASTAWTAGCGVETQIVGVVAEDDINTPAIGLLLARGQNSELGDVFAATDYAYWTYSPTDELHNGGNSSGERRIQISDYTNRPLASWAQTTEAAWSGIYAVERIRKIDRDHGINPDTDPVIARMWLNAGLGERQHGEQFCVAVFNYGPQGGILLDRGRGPYDPSNVVDADSVFRRVLAYADSALVIANAGVAAGVGRADDWYLFDAQVVQYSAWGLKAQTHLYLENWDLADQFAAMVPIDHIEYTHMNPGTEYNDVHRWNWRTDDVGAYDTPAHRLWEGDPRVPFVHCGEFVSDDSLAVLGVEKGFTRSSRAFINLTQENGCNRDDAVSNEYRLENNRFPRYPATKYDDRDADMEMVKGTDMLLIRAEVALRQDRLGDFTTYINQVRAFYDQDPIEEPAAAGALEYPNAEDDGWSILDRERYLTLWTEGRRFMDFRRWNHPYWEEGHYSSVYQASYAPEGPREYRCLPVPSGECSRNDLIRDTEHCAVLPPLGAS